MTTPQAPGQAAPDLPPSSIEDPSEEVVRHMSDARPWILGSIIILVLSGAVGLWSVIRQRAQLLPSGDSVEAKTMEMGVTMGTFIGSASLVLYLIVAFLLYNFLSATRRFCDAPDNASLEHALGKHRTFWKLSGILTIVFIIVSMVAVGIIAFYAVKEASNI